MTESLTKEERICLSTQWPPDTKTYLKLLRVHDELVKRLTDIEDAAKAPTETLEDQLGSIEAAIAGEAW
jgi:hypothetical protein